MKNRKKVVILIIIFLIAIGLIRGDLVIESNLGDGDEELQNKMQISEEELEEYINKEPEIKEYFGTLNKAFENSTFNVDGDEFYKVEKVLKTFEEDENTVIFGVTSWNKEDAFSVMRLKVKEENGIKEYSPIMQIMNSNYSNIETSFTKTNNIESQEKSLWRGFLSENSKEFRNPIEIIKAKHPNFKYSITNLDNVKYLEIKGERPDEIIPFNLDGNELYFYYYLDLEVNINEMEKRGSEDFKIIK